MCLANLKDPLMISLSVFTTIFIIVVSLACVEPWTIPSSSVRGRNTRDITMIPGPGDDQKCVYTYKAFQPNIDFFKEKVADITVDKCNENNVRKKRNRKRKRQRVNSLKSNDRVEKKEKKHKKKRGRKKKNRSKTKSRKSNRRGKKKRNKKIFQELKVFRRWKSVMNQNKLMSEPVAQKAVADLWSNLMEKGSHWKDIFDDMHLDQESSPATPSTTSAAT